MRLPLFVRIAAGYGLVLLVMLAIAVITLVRLQGATAVADRLSRQDAPALQAIDDLNVQIIGEQMAVNRFLLSSEATPGGREAFLGPYFQAHDLIFADLAALAAFARGAKLAGLPPAFEPDPDRGGRVRQGDRRDSLGGPDRGRQRFRLHSG